MAVDFTRFGLAILVIGMFDTKVAEFGFGHFERLFIAIVLWVITGYITTVALNKFGIK
jgi:hypothetical protein